MDPLSLTLKDGRWISIRGSKALDSTGSSSGGSTKDEILLYLPARAVCHVSAGFLQPVYAAFM